MTGNPVKTTLRTLLILTLLLPIPALAASWWEDLLGSLLGAESPTDPESDPVTPADSAAPITDAPRTTAAHSPTSAIDFGAGLRETLVVASRRVVERLATEDGFNADPRIHVPLPAALQSARGWLDRIGMAATLDELEVRLNRAAEAATPQARTLFVDAIRTMTIDDARAILQGGTTAATDYLRGRMSDPLLTAVQPVIDASLADVGALELLDTARDHYARIPMAPPLDLDVEQHVAKATVDGIFTYLAAEEAAIRADPAQRTTDLLRAVFSH